MPLLTGAMGCRRYRVLNQPESIPRDEWLSALHEHRFREPPSSARGGENLGWVSLQNLCVTEFTHEGCFFNQYFAWSFRIDNKKLPGKLLAALLDLRIQDWLAETGRERIPSRVKGEIKEQLELELFPRQLPSVAAHDIAWDLKEETIRIFTNSAKVNESFRILFSQSFGLETRAIGPVDLVAEHRNADAWMTRVDVIGHSDYRPPEA